MATSFTFGPALTQFAAAPRPRPPRSLPQPMSPTRITSLPAAWTFATLLQVVARPAPTAADVFKKLRREEATLCGVSAFKLSLLETRLERSSGLRIRRRVID